MSARRLVLITGGARAGKSRFAERLAANLGGDDVGFLATAEALDDDMRRRIARHREDRSAAWRTIEEPLDIPRAIAAFAPAPRVVIVDCLTLWVSNLLLRPDREAMLDGVLEREVGRLLEAVRSLESHVLFVTNEVGLGIVPETALGRRYRDLLGLVNQRIARAATDVYLLVSGIPVELRAVSFSLPDH